jgi:hypothetical protein
MKIQLFIESLPPVLSDENPILRIHPSSVSAYHSLSLCGACMRVFVTMIMTGEGVEVSKDHAVDEQHPNVVFARGPRPARSWCIFVHACVRAREKTRDENSHSDRGRQSVCMCFVGSECVSLHVEIRL